MTWLIELLVILVLVLWFFQHKLMYMPRPYQPGELIMVEKGDHGRRISLRTSQGTQVAFYVPPKDTTLAAPAFLWIVCGGNGSLSLDYVLDVTAWDRRFGFIFIDYPGYGLCQGDATPTHIRESIRAVVPQVWRDLGWNEEVARAHTGVFGHSLGCAASLIAATEMGLNRAILCAPFTSMTDMAVRTVGWPLCYLNRHRYDNVARLRELEAAHADVRAFHGGNDEVIPVTMSRELARLFPQTFHFTELPQSHHSEIVQDAHNELASAAMLLSGLGAATEK